jgi:hypothetical protein
VNRRYMYKVVCVMMLAGLQVGYLLSSLGPLEIAFRVKFHITKDRQGLELLLGAIGIIGMALGSLLFTLSFVRNMGRRKAIIYACFIGVLGTLL